MFFVFDISNLTNLYYVCLNVKSYKMKKLVLIGLLIGFISCSSDDGMETCPCEAVTWSADGTQPTETFRVRLCELGEGFDPESSSREQLRIFERNQGCN